MDFGQLMQCNVCWAANPGVFPILKRDVIELYQLIEIFRAFAAMEEFYAQKDGIHDPKHFKE